ncbi:DapH/DapD/GlmU-related protein [Halorarum salinum]|uniref:UDP-3-O-(3-hydroxymyristoyl)glucosamine N-acyltransferase n=1 Tax=Halorarum salinum TaxID=2743089 RepID=A0A7D5L899_9EURY|nr:DapH/DapD/GlmU-related protein [Halobaculum salinum]QLG60388.1 UDP-3-O-(3-hydroxymyristoyl)glucosamine N-acyltransferase [Halobaculum salinum]
MTGDSRTRRPADGDRPADGGRATDGDRAPGGTGTGLDAGELASFLDAEVTGPGATVTGVGSLADAGPNDLAFCTYDDPDAVRASDAGVVVCGRSIPALRGRTLVRVERPKPAFVEAANEFFVDGVTETTVHPSAVVEPGATVGERCRIGANAYVADCVTIGDGCSIGPGTVLGETGFGFARTDDDSLSRQVHDGEVVLEDDVAVGANCSIDRAVFDETVVRRGAKLSGNVHLAHQVEVGEDVTVAFGSGFAGGATVGARTTVHPQVSVATDVVVGADAELGMNAAVLEDVPAGTTVVGSPARPLGDSA